MKDAALPVCAKELCPLNPWGEGKVKRLLGKGAGLIFKGSGFYSTDYRSPGYQEAAKKEAGSGEGAKGGEKAAAAKDASAAQPGTKPPPSSSGSTSDSGNTSGSGAPSSAGSNSGSSSEKSRG